MSCTQIYPEIAADTGTSYRDESIKVQGTGKSGVIPTASPFSTIGYPSRLTLSLSFASVYATEKPTFQAFISNASTARSNPLLVAEPLFAIYATPHGNRKWF